jgi:hypothetical protein
MIDIEILEAHNKYTGKRVIKVSVSYKETIGNIICSLHNLRKEYKLNILKSLIEPPLIIIELSAIKRFDWKCSKCGEFFAEDDSRYYHDTETVVCDQCYIKYIEPMYED